MPKQSDFIEINGDIFNIDKIQELRRYDEKNCLGNDSGVYLLHIFMENDIGTQHKAYQSKKERDEDFVLARKQLMEVRKVHRGYKCV